MPREYTRADVLEKVVKHCDSICKYWAHQVERESTEELISGALFSLLVLLDGGSAGLPRFIVAPHPHPSDKEYLKNDEGENWFPENHELDDEIKSDLGGSLHDAYSALGRK